MNITQMYKYTKDGVVYVGANVPADTEVIETQNILVADGGYELIRIADEENVGSSIWLRNGDVQENYREEEHKNEPMD